MPAGGLRADLGFAVADDAGDQQVRIVEGLRQRVAELAAFMDRSRRFGGDVARDAAGNEQYGHRCEPKDLLRPAAQQQPIGAGSAARADDDKIRAPSCRLLDDEFRDPGARRFDMDDFGGIPSLAASWRASARMCSPVRRIKGWICSARTPAGSNPVHHHTGSTTCMTRSLPPVRRAQPIASSRPARAVGVASMGTRRRGCSDLIARHQFRPRKRGSA